MGILRKTVPIIFVLLALVASACGGDEPASNGGDAETPVRMRHYLGLTASPGSSPWFIAVERGFFEDAGVEVEILPGEIPSAGPSLIAAGDAETASVDFTTLALAKVEKPELPARLVAIHHQRSIQAVYSLKSGANIDEPEDLEGATLFERTGSTSGAILKVWADDHGYPVPHLEETDPDALDRLLISGQVPAVTSSVFSRGQLAAAAGAEGEELVVLELAKHGLEDFYGTGIAVNTEFAEENPEAVRAFITGMKAAFEWCFANKEEAGKIFSEMYPTFDVETVVASLETLESVTSDDGAVEFGTIEGDKVQATLDVIQKAYDVELEAEDMYTTEFTEG